MKKLVRALVLQLGREVFYNELGNLLGIDRSTVEHYIRFPEKCLAVFRLDALARICGTRQKEEEDFKIFYCCFYKKYYFCVRSMGAGTLSRHTA